MSRLEHASEVTDLAAELGLGRGTNVVDAILRHCRTRIDRWVAKATRKKLTEQEKLARRLQRSADRKNAKTQAEIPLFADQPEPATFESEQNRREDWERRQLEPEVIREFEQLEVQLKTFYDELSILSKKTPDGPLNKFKLKFVNDTLKKVNAILADTHRPFSDFELFSDADLPSSSDAVLMLSHYLKSMEQFQNDHSHWMRAGMSSVRYWCKKGDPLPDEKKEKEKD